MSKNKIENKCCVCDKYYLASQKSKTCSSNCRTFLYNQKNIIGIENKDYVLCKICNYKFKEINNDHTYKQHNISCIEYDKLFGINSRTSENTRERKKTLLNMSEETSLKLKKSHYLPAYIEKYGKIIGTEKYYEKISNVTKCKKMDYYIDKYGKVEGEKIFNEIQEKKKISLENMIKKHGEDIGTEKYNSFLNKQKIKNTLSYFIEIYGESGIERWLSKNEKISLSNSIIENDKRTDFKKYLTLVNKYTRLTLQYNVIPNIHLRGHKYSYDLDHIVSKIDGFRNNVEPYIIAHKSNLRIIDSSKNRKKQHKSDINIEYIMEEFDKDIEYKKLIENIKYINNDTY